MAYRSGFEGAFGLGALLGAVVPASIAAAAIGVFCNAVIILLFERPSFDIRPVEFLLIIMAAGIMIAAAIVAAAFVVAFYLVVFGLPIATLLGRHIAHPAALGIAVIDALGAAAFAVGRTVFDSSIEHSFPWTTFLMVGCFALPAGYLYRRNVIIMREEAELCA